MAKRRSESKEREMLAYLQSRHPADLSVKEQAELQRLKEKYGSI